MFLVIIPVLLTLIAICLSAYGTDPKLMSYICYFIAAGILLWSLIKIIKKHKVDLEHMLNANPNFPINVSGLFIHPIKILETDIHFMERVIEQIKEGGEFSK